MPFPARVDVAGLGDLALRAVEEHGWDGWTATHVADLAGVTPTALQRHGGRRGGLAAGAGAAAARALQEHVRVAAREQSHPVEALRAAVLAYLAFSEQRPDAYEAFVRAKPDDVSPHREAWVSLWGTLRELTTEVAPRAADATAFAVWTLAHGHADLARGPARLPDGATALATAVDALVDGMLRRGPVASPLPSDLAQDDPPPQG